MGRMGDIVPLRDIADLTSRAKDSAKRSTEKKAPKAFSFQANGEAERSEAILPHFPS